MAEFNQNLKNENKKKKCKEKKGFELWCKSIRRSHLPISASVSLFVKKEK